MPGPLLVIVCESLLPPKVPFAAPSSCTWSMGRPLVGRFQFHVMLSPLREERRLVGVFVSP